MVDKDQQELVEEFEKRFAELPKVIQDAINSADVEKRLRELITKHHLHLDQWVGLENEVMLALYGFQPAEDLQKNLRGELGISDETAAALSADISRIVFEPIRQELERELEHPEAKAKQVSGVEAAREQALAGREQTPIAPQTPATPPVMPATPPPTPPTEKAIRAPASGAYKPGEASVARKDIHDDPYREPPA